MKHFTQGPGILFVLLLLVMGASSCGGGGGGGGGVLPSSGGTGTVGVLLTDKPSEEFSEVWVTITQIQLISDERKVNIFSGEKTIDLLKLADEETLFSVTTDVPAITYNKIRLQVAEVHLVDLDGHPIDPAYVKLTGNGKLDLNPRRSFRVQPGGTLIMKIDMDAQKSIHIHLTGNHKKYMFRPVVFIDIVNGLLTTDKLIRLEGRVSDLDPATETFTLCPLSNTLYWPTRSAYDEDSRDDLNHLSERCVQVDVSEGTSIFGEDGGPAEFSDLEADDRVTVVGRFSTIHHRDQECRNGQVLCFDDDSMLVLDAEVIEIGEFLQLRGTILPDDLGGLLFEFSPDQGIIVDPAAGTQQLTLQLQEGTKIFSRTGEALSESFLMEHLPALAEVDGVLIAPEENLRAALIILDISPSTVTERFEGTISEIDYDQRTFVLRPLPGSIGDPLCVEALGAHVLLITEGSTSYGVDSIPFSSLSNGQEVEVLGYFDPASPGCLIAEDIVAESIL